MLKILLSNKAAEDLKTSVDIPKNDGERARETDTCQNWMTESKHWRSNH
jgi:hypothetical protein